MLCPTERFGVLEVKSEDLIDFPKGLPGFPELTRYFLVPVAENPVFTWLQAADDPAVAFLLTNPFLFFPGYEVRVSPAEEELLGAKSPEDVAVYVILRVPAGGGTRDITANLLAPVLIHQRQRRGCQVVMEGAHYRIREPLFGEKGGRSGADSQP